MYFLQDPLIPCIFHSNRFLFVLPKRPRNKLLLATHGYCYASNGYHAFIINAHCDERTLCRTHIVLDAHCVGRTFCWLRICVLSSVYRTLLVWFMSLIMYIYHTYYIYCKIIHLCLKRFFSYVNNKIYFFGNPSP